MIEISNIHRQIAHDIKSVGKSKAKNLADKCRALNDFVECVPYEFIFEKLNAISTIKQYPFETKALKFFFQFILPYILSLTQSKI
jgi:molybdopterin/thiamine biosynthesis adenylyltransferase